MAKQLIFQKTLTQAKLCKNWNNHIIKDLLLVNLDESKKATSLEQLRGIEGMASSLYWSAFGMKCTEYGFKWNGRKKHPSEDAVNLSLSLGYGLLATQVQTMLQTQGFDSYLGILHTTSHTRPALVYDIIYN